MHAVHCCLSHPPSNCLGIANNLLVLALHFERMDADTCGVRRGSFQSFEASSKTGLFAPRPSQAFFHQRLRLRGQVRGAAAAPRVVMILRLGLCLLFDARTALEVRSLCFGRLLQQLFLMVKRFSNTLLSGASSSL